MILKISGIPTGVMASARVVHQFWFSLLVSLELFEELVFLN